MLCGGAKRGKKIYEQSKSVIYIVTSFPAVQGHSPLRPGRGWREEGGGWWVVGKGRNEEGGGWSVDGGARRKEWGVKRNENIEDRRRRSRGKDKMRKKEYR